MVGRRLGHYTVLERIGAGGMGVVYRARDERLQREVALKVLPEGLLADDAARRRFRREALALSQLNHPNIATIHDFDSDGGIDFLVLEFIPGVSLDARIATGRLPEAEVVRLGIQLAQGLEAAHARGIVHCDLKPSNLRITPDGRLEILDFGIARWHQRPEDLTLSASAAEPGAITGSLPYMAPEQLRGGAPDPRSDIYATGAVLYEMATGQRPFRADVPARLLFEVLHDTPPAPRTIAADLSQGLEALILRALEKDPSRRPRSAGELRYGLEAVAAPLVPTAAGGPAAPPAMRPQRVRSARATGLRPRRPGPVAVAAVGATLGAAALLLVLTLDPGGLRGRLAGLFGGSRIHAIAVLPLEDLSRDPAQAYFADGMTDQLIAVLAQVGALRVISRTSVMPYKGAKKTPREVSRELGVDAVVEGTVLRSGGRVRITAELVRARDDRSLWAESYDRDLRDVLSIQSDVARAIVQRIEVRLLPQEATRLASAARVDPEAYQAYLRGRYAWRSFDEKGFAQAESYFHHALEIDPSYAPAYSGLADTYYGRSNLYLSPNEAIPRARAAAEKALALDPGLAEAHISLGIVKTVYDWDWTGAEREFRQALSLEPNAAMAHLWLGQELVAQGRFDEGVAESRRALDLDPLSLWIDANLGWHLYYAGRYREAELQLRSAIRLDPDSYLAYGMLGEVLEQMGDAAGAVAALEKETKLDSNPDGLSQLGHAYATAGRRSDAERVLRELLQRQARSFVPACDIARVYAGL